MRKSASFAGLGLLGALFLIPAQATAQPSPQATQPGAYVLFDNFTGAVIEAHNERTPLPPASITKLLTALVATNRLEPHAKVTVGPKAEAMPALKIGVKAGEAWPVDDLLHALLLVSANDAAVALAEEISGSVDAFAADRYKVAGALGLADSPVLNDPSGLDDAEFSANGGDRISARDMGIIARAASAQPELAAMMGKQRYDFKGPNGEARHMLNHNRLLKTYPGATGMKTGYTRQAKQTLVASATRENRSLIAVVLGSDRASDFAAQLLDRGFAVPATPPSGADILPKIAVPISWSTAQAGEPVDNLTKRGGNGGLWLLVPAVVLVSVGSYGRRRWRNRDLIAGR